MPKNNKCDSKVMKAKDGDAPECCPVDNGNADFTSVILVPILPQKDDQSQLNPLPGTGIGLGTCVGLGAADIVMKESGVSSGLLDNIYHRKKKKKSKQQQLPFIPIASFMRRPLRGDETGSGGISEWWPCRAEGEWCKEIGKWTEFGRREIIQAIHSACGCRQTRAQVAESEANEDDCGMRTSQPLLPLCHSCRTIEEWALPLLSRRMVRFRPLNDEDLPHAHFSSDVAAPNPVDSRTDEGDSRTISVLSGAKISEHSSSSSVHHAKKRQLSLLSFFSNSSTKTSLSRQRLKEVRPMRHLYSPPTTTMQAVSPTITTPFAIKEQTPSSPKFIVQIRGQNARNVVFVDSCRIVVPDKNGCNKKKRPTTQRNQDKPLQSEEDAEGWSGNAFMSIGSVISFVLPRSLSPTHGDAGGDRVIEPSAKVSHRSVQNDGEGDKCDDILKFLLMFSSPIGHKKKLPDELDGITTRPKEGEKAEVNSHGVEMIKEKRFKDDKETDLAVACPNFRNKQPGSSGGAFAFLEEEMESSYSFKWKDNDAETVKEIKQMDREEKQIRPSGSLPSTQKKEVPKYDNAAVTASKTETEFANSADTSVEPVIGKIVPTPSGVRWKVVQNCLLVRTVLFNVDPHRTKVAAFDLDQTLVLWRCPGWPSKGEHYELWSHRIPSTLRKLYDDEKYKLVIFSNQGGVRNAFHGKTAFRVKGIVDWIADLVNRPIHAVISTKKDSGYHKGNPDMWTVAEQICNGAVQMDPTQSFYVGDAAGVTEGEQQLKGNNKIMNGGNDGVDRIFAENIGAMRGEGITLHFSTPDEYFGCSDADRRKEKAASFSMSYDVPPPETMHTRAALLGGYLRGPIVLILCGAQGSGKSTFCHSLVKEEGDDDCKGSSFYRSLPRWVHLSQDTIRNGKPGKRSDVEKAATAAISKKQNVVIDRMHLDTEQRSYFIAVAQANNIPAHAIVLNVPRGEMERRVRERTEHPGGVQGESGARRAVSSLDRLQMPQYSEGLALISSIWSTSPQNCMSIRDAYRRIVLPEDEEKSRSQHTTGNVTPATKRKTIQACKIHGRTLRGFPLHDTDGLTLPSMSLGTMGVRKQDTSSLIIRARSIGLHAVDTAPTYKNEDEIGEALQRGANESFALQQIQAHVPKNCERNTILDRSRQSGISNDRVDECFVIVKVPKRAIQPSQVRNEVLTSLRKLRLKSASLLLVHWPCDLFESGTLTTVWRELEQMKMEGLCKSLGVSNFSIGALRSLLAICSSARPVVNQVERHLLLPQWELINFCSVQNIIVQAHTPLGGQNGRGGLLQQPALVRISEEVGLSPAQVIWKWNIQQGIAVTAKCFSEHHLREAWEVMNEKYDKDHGCGFSDNTEEKASSNIIPLSPGQMRSLDEVGFYSLQSSSSCRRFVAPPFMYKRGAPYSWGDKKPHPRQSRS